jgi:hypothetical protein
MAGTKPVPPLAPPILPAALPLFLFSLQVPFSGAKPSLLEKMT